MELVEGLKVYYQDKPFYVYKKYIKSAYIGEKPYNQFLSFKQEKTGFKPTKVLEYFGAISVPIVDCKILESDYKTAVAKIEKQKNIKRPFSYKAEHELKNIFYMTKEKGNAGTYEIESNKSIVLFYCHREKNTMLFKLNNAEKFYFYNVETKEYHLFDKKKHKKGHGGMEVIEWP